MPEGEGARAVSIDPQEKFSLMVNEEDHLRIQVMNSGLDLHAAWEQINSIDDLIEVAFDVRLPRTLGLSDRLSRPMWARGCASA